MKKKLSIFTLSQTIKENLHKSEAKKKLSQKRTTEKNLVQI